MTKFDVVLGEAVFKIEDNAKTIEDFVIKIGKQDWFMPDKVRNLDGKYEDDPDVAIQVSRIDYVELSTEEED